MALQLTRPWPQEVVPWQASRPFIAPLTLWSRDRYERQWADAAVRLLAGAERTAFFTVAWQFWWTMARQGHVVLVQEELLPPARVAGLGTHIDPDRVPYDLLQPLRLQSEEGRPISTWRIPLSDVAAFAGRQPAGDAT